MEMKKTGNTMPFICSLLSVHTHTHTHTHWCIHTFCVIGFFSFSLAFSSFRLRVFATPANVTASMLLHSRAFHSFYLPLLLLLLRFSFSSTHPISFASHLSICCTFNSIFFFALLFAHFRKIFNYKSYNKLLETKLYGANKCKHRHRAKQRAFLQCDYSGSSSSSSILCRYRYIWNSVTTRTMLTTSTTIKMDLCARALMLHCMLTSYRL